jgi:hypothetical protein
MESGASSLFLIIPLIILLGFILIGGLIIFLIAKSVRQWHSNNQQPIQTVPALIVAKRSHVSGGSGNSSAHTTYYATFELPGGERRELHVPSSIYGQLAEGDQGQVTFQGTRFKGYNRLGPAQPMQRTW